MSSNLRGLGSRVLPNENMDSTPESVFRELRARGKGLGMGRRGAMCSTWRSKQVVQVEQIQISKW